jgi:hypothetical protein
MVIFKKISIIRILMDARLKRLRRSRGSFKNYFKKNVNKIITLYDKLDKKITLGRKYTEEEINEILKENCLSIDYTSFRRKLINDGYLNRTNDCREYWREK